MELPTAHTDNAAEGAAAAALCDMAARRGLHARREEAQQAWRLVHAQTLEQKLVAAWRWLFPGHGVEQVPLALARHAQLPAWIVDGSAIGIVTRLSDEDQPAIIDWLGAAPPAAPEATRMLWVPITPMGNEEEFVVKKKRGPATQAIVTALRDHLPLFRRVGYASLLMNALSIVSSLFAMQVYDRVVPNFAYSTLWVLASGTVLAFVFELLFKIIRLKLLEASALRLDEALSLYFFETLMALKLDRRPSRIGTLVAQVRDYESVKSFFTSTTLFVLADLPFTIFFIVIIALIGGPIALVPIVWVPISIAIGLAVYRPLAELQRIQTDQASRKTGLLFEAVAGAEGIKAQAGESRFADVWLRATREAAEIGERLRSLNSYASFAAATWQQIAYVALLIVGVYTIQAGHLTMGGLIACSILAGRTLNSITQITQLLLSWHQAKHSLQILDAVLSCPTDDAPGREANTRAATLDLSVSDLRYAYEGSSTAQLVVPALSIKGGERIAIIGRNGSGKSTLLKVLAGIATPSAGEVHIGGLDMQQCRPGWLREVIGYLPQEVRLFSGTLAENLTLGLGPVDEGAVRAALESTGLLNAMGRHPLGLNLPIREGGAGMSGGQRQMVGLTRLLLQQPKLWLLDEPSASLDSESEGRLIRLINEQSRQHTILFTSHRQSWLGLADRVLLLEDGVIKADTTGARVRAIQNSVAAQQAPAITAGAA